MNEELTDWFYGTTPPVREGVYEVRSRGYDGAIHFGYCRFFQGRWCHTTPNPKSAIYYTSHSPQQSKEWRGLAKEPK